MGKNSMKKMFRRRISLNNFRIMVNCLHMSCTGYRLGITIYSGEESSRAYCAFRYPAGLLWDITQLHPHEGTDNLAAERRQLHNAGDAKRCLMSAMWQNKQNSTGKQE